MKGLLLKDWYMINKYCRTYLLIAAVFIVVSFAGDDNLFFLAYPCLFCGSIPVTLLGYDEHSRWMQYSGTLPYTKTQIVSAKYLIGLLAQLSMIIITGIAQGIKTAVSGDFVFGEFVVLIPLLLIVSTLTSSFTLPFIFKLGAEKGRIAYYVMIGFICGVSVLSSRLIKGRLISEIQPNAFLAILSIVCVGVYILSWYLSVVFYKKREI